METKANGKRIQVYGKSDIAEAFTSIVQCHLMSGYMFNYADNSRGHQGEDLSAYLTNDGGKTVVAVFADGFTEFDGGMRMDGIKVFIKKYEDADSYHTLWMDKGELVSETKFYKINRSYKKDIFVPSKDDLKAIRQIQRKRAETEQSLCDLNQWTALPQSAHKPALKILKKIKGHKSARLSDITKVARHDKVYVAYVKDSVIGITLNQAFGA